MDMGLTPQERTFRCPGCNEVTETGRTTCLHCGRSIGTEEAERGANLSDALASAHSEASNLRNLTMTTLPVFGLSLLPAFGMLTRLFGYAAFVMWISVPFFLLRWFKRHRQLGDHPELKDAKRNLGIGAAVWGLTAIGYLALLVLLLGVMYAAWRSGVR